MPTITNSSDLADRHQYATSLYGEWRAFAAEVETLWRGEGDKKTYHEDSDIQISRSSEPYALLHKVEQMVGIRAKKRIKVMPFNDSENELRRVDKVERFLRAFLTAHRRATNKDTFRLAGQFALLRGRGPIQTLYRPNRKHGPSFRMRALDPYDVNTVFGEDGVDWWTSERWMTRQQLYDYFIGLPEELQTALRESGAIKEAEIRSAPQSRVRIVEYWDDKVFAWGVGNTLAHQHEHDYGCVTLREIRLGQTGLNNERWNSMPFLGPVVDDLKAISALQSKMLTAVDISYFDEVLYKDTEGGLTLFNRYPSPGEKQEVSEGFVPIILKKGVNSEVMNAMYSVFRGNVNKNTLSELAYALDMPSGGSGFQASQILTQVQDAIADIVDQMEWVFGQVLGDVLKLHEVYDDGSGYEYAATYGKRGVGVERITAADIAGHYDVNVAVHPSLPQDMLQKTTLLNQLYKRDPATGELMFDIDTALEVSTLDEHIEDVSKMKRAIQWDMLKQKDPEVAALSLAAAKADFAPDIAALKKAVEKAENQQQKRDQRQLGRDIERGMSSDVVLPAEIAGNPQKMMEYAQMISQGMTPQGALDTLLNQGGLPMGVPGQPMQPPAQGGGASPEAMELARQMFGGADVQVGQEVPDGLTGYADGTPTSVLPPAMKGALPRRVVDAPNVQIENAEELMRRGGLPPAK